MAVNDINKWQKRVRLCVKDVKEVSASKCLDQICSDLFLVGDLWPLPFSQQRGHFWLPTTPTETFHSVELLYCAIIVCSVATDT